MILALNKVLKNYYPLTNSNALCSVNILFLRKARLFVKSRYSRNRQWSKSIVYFGLWFNIISVIWATYYCYRYIFIFSHLYWLGFTFVAIWALRASSLVKTSTFISFLRNLTWKF